MKTQLIYSIDSSLKWKKRLKAGLSLVYQVQKETSLYVLKIVPFYLGPDNWRVNHLRRETTLLEMAKEVEGITHLVKDYGKNPKSKCAAILKEYFEGKSPEKEITDTTLQQKLQKTVRQLHSLGIADFDICSTNIIISPDKKTAKMVDFGSYLRFSSHNSHFKAYERQDNKNLDDLFKPIVW